ncbi:hypothetical protein [Nostoc sp. JL33]|uniref:hypothetical protein n=1 Tax=Nostoc sp. JL33 TaxID=2815396 RepID=UPI0025F4D61B|nr:hypothetical protein [Nostoc sp. JL33]MBN3870075.1 hypothetical protein [Nostoc sp. JL33]
MGIIDLVRFVKLLNQSATGFVYFIAWLKSRSAGCKVGAMQKPAWQQVFLITRLFD